MVHFKEIIQVGVSALKLSSTDHQLVQECKAVLEKHFSRIIISLSDEDSESDDQEAVVQGSSMSMQNVNEISNVGSPDSGIPEEMLMNIKVEPQDEDSILVIENVRTLSEEMTTINDDDMSDGVYDTLHESVVIKEEPLEFEATNMTVESIELGFQIKVENEDNEWIDVPDKDEVCEMKKCQYVCHTCHNLVYKHNKHSHNKSHAREIKIAKMPEKIVELGCSIKVENDAIEWTDIPDKDEVCEIMKDEVICLICNKVVYKWNLSVHNKLHPRFPCRLCPRTFKGLSALKGHYKGAAHQTANNPIGFKKSYRNNPKHNGFAGRRKVHWRKRKIRPTQAIKPTKQMTKILEQNIILEKRMRNRKTDTDMPVIEAEQPINNETLRIAKECQLEMPNICIEQQINGNKRRRVEGSFEEVTDAAEVPIVDGSRITRKRKLNYVPPVPLFLPESDDISDFRESQPCTRVVFNRLTDSVEGVLVPSIDNESTVIDEVASGKLLEKFICYKCESHEIFETKLEYDLHRSMHRVHCRYCPKSYLIKKRLAEHIKKMHKNGTPLPDLHLQCKICLKLFNSKHLYNKHVVTHLQQQEESFVCSLCNQEFKSQALLECHEYVEHDLYSASVEESSVDEAPFVLDTAFEEPFDEVPFDEVPFDELIEDLGGSIKDPSEDPLDDSFVEEPFVEEPFVEEPVIEVPSIPQRVNKPSKCKACNSVWATEERLAKHYCKRHVYLALNGCVICKTILSNVAFSLHAAVHI